MTPPSKPSITPTPQLVDKLEHRHAAIAAIGQIALEAIGLDTVMANAADRLARAIEVDFVEILELSPDGGTLLLCGGKGWTGRDIGTATMPTSEHGLAEFTLLAGEPIIVIDAKSERRFRSSAVLTKHRVVSELSTLIAGSNGPYGVLAVHTKQRREFTSDDVHFLRAVANMIAAAVKQRNAEAALRDLAARMSAIVTTAVDGIISINERGIIDSVNAAAERLFGYSEADLIGKNVSVLMPEPYSGEHDGYLMNYLRTGQARIIGIGREVVGRRNDGSTFPMELAVSEMRVNERRMFTGLVRDVTERRRLELEILKVASEEQRRIGQDLHDGLCQQLTGVAFALEVLGQKLAARAAPETASIRKIAELVDQSISQSRELARGLQPVTLDAAGLVLALQEFATKTETLFHISCLFMYNQPILVHDNTVATHLYRITQEAVANAIKHGKAKTIVIELSSDGETLHLSITDDGLGLRGPRRDTQGMGLQTMSYRARVINGTLDVRPGKHGGTIVLCSMSLKNAGMAITVKPAAEDQPDGKENRKTTSGKTASGKGESRKAPDRKAAAAGKEKRLRRR